MSVECCYICLFDSCNNNKASLYKLQQQQIVTTKYLLYHLYAFLKHLLNLLLIASVSSDDIFNASFSHLDFEEGIVYLCSLSSSQQTFECVMHHIFGDLKH